MSENGLIFPPQPQRDGIAVSDVVSFYNVSFRVLNHPVHTSIRAAYLFYIASTATELADLMEDALVLAKSVSGSEWKKNIEQNIYTIG